MNKQIVKFLEFKGKNIVYLSANGRYWIAIKPVCEALKIEYTRQFKNICLPEEYIYGWIFSIQSDSKDLQDYKLEFCKALFNHFHRTITRRHELIREKADISIKRRKLEHRLAKNPDYIELSMLRGQEISIGKRIKNIERGEIQGELDLFNQKV